jgi:hypothetical protein
LRFTLVVVFFMANSLDFGREIHRVVGRVHFDVVVEVDIHVAALEPRRSCDELRGRRLAAVAPRANERSPTFERLLGVAALVELDVAVQADVDEVGRDVREKWPAARRVRHDERDVVLAQERDELGRREALVPHFERMTKVAIRARA